jgi:7,8-dihydro-6-hydroxymethylpterin dimethyltransferase
MRSAIDGPGTLLSPEEVRAYQPEPPTTGPGFAMIRARRRMVETGQWDGAQCMGRRWPIGCVALEVTQRCNLDCTLCYLSETAEAVKDLPLEELFRRIDTIFEMYGPNTDIQVTGGDPTLRRREELVAVIRRIRERGMRPSLFTNGIRATRSLLKELAEAGLVDVAFHVDMTQQRKGFSAEVELNQIRREYIGRVRGLGLSVMFNTTVFSENAHEISKLAAFFVANSDVVSLASFQLGADTGRGRARGRSDFITPDSVSDAIRGGTTEELSFGFPRAGHRACNRYAMALVCNGHAYNAYDEPEAMGSLLAATAHMPTDRQDRWRAVTALALALLLTPRLLPTALRLALSKAWQMRRDLVAARGKVSKISFFIHNFMSACSLERDRVAACAFMVATADGPISMCLHNARRDDFLLQPLAIRQRANAIFWNPITGGLQNDPHPVQAPILPPKLRKGRDVLDTTAPTTENR